ncbi:MAG: TetR/AcrR family transcriptional regulator [Deltaproteobacteria bacterium]|nr:TetR/AcrR family transcriptional regulator [Deltaproteobacteria bacterium]
MARQRKRTRDEWVAASFAALAEGGIDAVRVERLARTLGVTKGSFYWHFTDRAALVTAMLDAWETGGTRDVIARVDAHGGDAGARLRQLCRVTSRDGELTAELALRDWARRDADVAMRVQRVDDVRMAYIRALFEELFPNAEDIEARSMLLYSLLIGNDFIVARHGRRGRARVLKDAVELLLAQA